MNPNFDNEFENHTSSALRPRQIRHPDWEVSAQTCLGRMSIDHRLIYRDGHLFATSLVRHMPPSPLRVPIIYIALVHKHSTSFHPCFPLIFIPDYLANYSEVVKRLHCQRQLSLNSSDLLLDFRVNVQNSYWFVNRCGAAPGPGHW